jgi:tRNA A-37 threonylcarbamoyl transferase component Bud32/ribosomal protein S27AE
MVAVEREATLCPACGAIVDTHGAEPLARVTCPKCGEPVRVDRAFDNFVLLETVGVGGMGSVYKARDTRLDRFVALKILRTELSANAQEAARLEQEARLTAAVNHPHVVQVFSSGTDHGQLYLVMELIGGGSLDDLMAQHTRVPEAQVLKTGIGAARGLRAAHAKGLMHRDVKPANILFADGETAKIGDFGLAVAAGPSTDAQNEIWGTPYYVAPERLNSEPEDFRSDVYSLGATLFHALAGVPPIAGESNSASKLRELKMTPADVKVVAPDISRRTARIINRMIAPDPGERFESYAELIDELEEARNGLVGIRRGISRKWLLTAAALVILATAGTAAYVNYRRTGPDPDAVPLARLYDDARRQLIAGKLDIARTEFARLGEQVHDRQPMLNWVRLHGGLTSLLLGSTIQARQAFEEVANAGLYSLNAADGELPKFFADTARTMIDADKVTSGAVADPSPQTPQSFTLLLFAMKDWYLRDFGDAAALFERFERGEPAGAFTWINDYKPIAQKYLADYRIYTDWRKQPKNFDSPERVAAGLESVRTAISKLQTHGPLRDELRQAEASLAGPSPNEANDSAAAATQPSKRAPNDEMAAWNSVLAKYRERVRSYDFAGALAAVRSAKLHDPQLKTAQDRAAEKARWLIEWKDQLIADVSQHGFNGAITDLEGNSYNGIAAANATHLMMKLPYGLADSDWMQFSPVALLGVATALSPPDGPEVADRKWRCAMFATEIRQKDFARSLAESAANVKPEYRERVQALTAPR